MNITRISALSIAAATLAACGGSGGGTTGPTITEPTTQDVARADVASASVFTDWVEVGDTRTVVRNRPDGNTATYALTLEDVDAFDGSTFASFSNAESGPRFRSFEAKGPGGIEARVTGFVNDQVNLLYAPQAEYITTGGSIPLSGTANFSGDYAGMLTRRQNLPNPNFTSSYVTGEVQLTADFGSERLDGRISDRQAYATSNDSESNSLADLTLNALELTGGRSSNSGGSTSGGVIQNSSYVATGGNIFGNWQAAVAGEEAEAIAGSISVFHNYNNNNLDLNEVGVFVATKD